MITAHRLRERLAAGRLTLGCIVTMHVWTDFLELARDAGMDYLILDMEHLQHDAERVADLCAIGRMAEFPILVRPQSTHPDAISLAADLGPCGLLLPMMNSPEDLDRVVQGLHMPPRGQRRPGGRTLRWTADLGYEGMRQNLEEPLVIIAQIESPEGVANAAAIAKHELVTAVGVGPYDLSARLGVCWQPDSELLQSHIARIRVAADAAGKPMWNIGDGATLQRAGYHFLCVAEPTFLLHHTLKTLVKDLRKADAEADGHAKAAPDAADTSAEGEGDSAFVP